jgi:bifunctional DNase/RNase
MQKDVVEVSVKGVMPTANGCAVFLGNEDKTFVIYVDHSVGNAIQMTINGVKKDRPLTHDLIGHILIGLGAKLDYVLINDVNEGTFFARILLRMENELGKKIIEIDARPSDSTVLALQQKRPIFASRKVFDAVEDMSEILERVLQQQAQETNDDESEGDDDDEEEDDDDDIDLNELDEDDDEKK